MQVIRKDRRPEDKLDEINGFFKVSYDSFGLMILSWVVLQDQNNEKYDFRIVLTASETRTLIDFVSRYLSHRGD